VVAEDIHLRATHKYERNDIPIYFNNPKYFIKDMTNGKAIPLQTEPFLTECANSLVRDNISLFVLIAAFRCTYNYNLGSWHKLDTLVIPYESITKDREDDKVELILTSDKTGGTGGSEKRLASLISKCNMTGKYENQIIDLYSRRKANTSEVNNRIYPFHTIHQYKANNKDYITITTFEYSEYSQVSHSNNCLVITGYTTTNDKNIQGLLAETLSNYEINTDI
jgi:hypothetical protein